MPPQETFFCKQPPVFEFKHFNQEIKVSRRLSFFRMVYTCEYAMIAHRPL